MATPSKLQPLKPHDQTCQVNYDKEIQACQPETAKDLLEEQPANGKGKHQKKNETY